MKQWRRRIVVFLAVVCIFLGEGTFRNVMAEETQNSNKVPDTYYDVGSKIGIFELKSNTNSLKVGDTAEIEVWFDPEYANEGNLGYSFTEWNEMLIRLCYDADVFQYKDVTVKSGSNIACSAFESTNCITLQPECLSGFNQNGYMMTINFEVKKEVSSALFYTTDIDASGDMYTYLTEDDEAEDGRKKAMSLTVTDANPSTPSQTAGTFTLSAGTCEGSGEIVVPIKIQSNDGFAVLGLTINYDATLFDYKSLEVDSSLADKIALKDANSTEGQIRAAYVAGQDITDVGSFLNLTLEAKDSAQAGTASDVTVEITQVANYEEKSLDGTGAKYTVTLKDNSVNPNPPGPSGQKLGDVNNDGNIDLLDALCILQNYNGVKELDNNAKTAADVDKNGVVDLVDALRIMKYYNGEISGF